MADHYKTHTNNSVTVTYHSIGSGGGIRQFIDQEVMFGMSEAYLPDEKMVEVESRTGGKAFNMPITLADVVPTYNIPGISSGVIFNGQVLADIYLGTITNWNDERIKSLNPEIQFPNLEISVIYRTDGSGTTNILTNYLNSVSAEWAKLVGKGTLVKWPVGKGAKGNEGVADLVIGTEGSIGYNSFAFALLNNMGYGSIINLSGITIEPSLAATTEAANIELPADTRVIFTNTTAINGYPIAGFTWVLVYENLNQNKAISNIDEARELIHFLVWMITKGQDLSEMLGYARLPQTALLRNIEMIKQLKWEGKPIGLEIVQNTFDGKVKHQ
jgi:phosphate transport system substrate-binding protein